MFKKILITGGAGFIGSHLADDLLAQGYEVRVLDSLSQQVHGPSRQRPDYLSPEVELLVGDVRDADALRRSLKGVDAIFHLAAMVGVGQSMYEVAQYTEVNNQGTANLLQVLIEEPVEKLIVASSMSLYGEGLYRTVGGDLLAGSERSIQQLKAKQWELHDLDGSTLAPVPTPETKIPSLSSVYALSKYDQERLALIIGRAYQMPTVALRFFNVYGTRQALSNPYTGVMAIFASRLMNEKAPMIFEDGLQQRDFVSVHDVARACRLSLETPEANGCALNVGSGCHYTIRELAERIARVMGKEHI
ncbi:MAG TPA: NAD-dependent epimerase/dehydratase family protein, partial [Verrucomicrobiae bacterium]|nr:NAD-dependent epimerase/dehydratase family protein [Verrucomicrobiae bacterium]